MLPLPGDGIDRLLHPTAKDRNGRLLVWWLGQAGFALRFDEPLLLVDPFGFLGSRGARRRTAPRSVLEPAHLAVLHERLLVIGRRWPGLMGAVLRRSAQQLRHAQLHQAISQLPRVEDRLLALLWSIADRRGVVRGDGVWVRLPVTHDMLAHMIGARRPTVSLGLRALADQGLLRAQDGGWLLARASLDELPGRLT